MSLEKKLMDGENPNQRSNIIPIVLMGSVVVTASIVNALWLSDNMDYVSDTFYNFVIYT